MTLQRTLVATCDTAANDCDQQVDLDPSTTQPWRDLTKIGWGVKPALLTTYCPNHRREATP